MQSLSERTAGFTDSVIRRMTRVSMQYDAVNLSQGFPDFEPPKELLDRLAQVAYEDYHQYSLPGVRRTSARRWPPSRPISWAAGSTRTPKSSRPAAAPRR